MPSISDIKKLYPEAKNLSDDQIMSVFNEYVMDNVKSVYPEAKGLSQDEVFGVIGNQHRIVKNAGVAGRVKDFGLDVAKGVIGAGESVVGLADLVTGNAAGNFLRDSIGYDPKTSKQMLDSWQSDERQQESRAVQDTKGFVNTLGALVDNPAVAVGAVGESAPLMLGTAGAVRAAATQMLSKAGLVAGTEEAAKFLARPEVASRLALIGSATEGAMTAGNIQETARQEGRNWSDSAGYAAAGGLGTAAIGRLASKILPDADVLAGTAGLGAKTGAKEGMLSSAKAIGKGIVQEGVLEEMPQSAQEQVASNLALGKPWDEGVSEAAAMGLATGGLMGGGMTAANRFAPAVKTDPFQDFADAVEGTNFNPDATARDAMLDQVQSIDPRLTRIAQAEQTKAAAQQAIATAPTIDAAVDAFNVATAAGSSSMVDQSQLLNDVNEVANASIAAPLAEETTQANDAQVGVEQAAAPEVNPQNPQNPQVATSGEVSKSVETFGENDDINRQIYTSNQAPNDGLRVLQYPDGRRFVQTVDIDPAKRGKGIGQSLYKAALADGDLEIREQFMSEDAKRVYAALVRKGDAEIVERDGKRYLTKTVPAQPTSTKPLEPTKPTKPKKDRKAVYPESDSALVAIAKLGGMDTQQLLTNGFDQKDISVLSRGKTIGKRAMQTGGEIPKNAGQIGKGSMRAKQVGFNMPIHRNGGMSFDGMREALVQYGYLPEGASVNDAIELLRRELRGEPVYTASAVQAQAEAAEADRQAMMEAEQEANEASGYDELQGTAEERAADALIEELYGEEVAALARGMRVAGLTEEEINAEIKAFNQRTGAQDGAGQSQERSGEGRAEESGTDAEVFGGEESAEPDWLKDDFGLEGQTNEEAAAEYKQQQAEANKQEAEPPAKNVTVDQVDIFNEQGGLRFSKGGDGFESSPDAEREFKETERAYGGREAYGRAVESGKTKLNYRQWVQVRTPKFKAWFGDWEGLRAQQKLDAMPPVNVAVPDEWRGLDEKTMREKMVEALDALIESGDPIVHPDLGEIRVGKKGKDKSKSTSKDPAKMLLVADIGSALPKAIYAKSEAPNGNEQGVDGYGTMLLPVSIDGIGLIARITIRHQPDGHWYYNAVNLLSAKEEAQDSYGSPGTLSRPLGKTPITGLDSFIRQPLRRVNPDSVSKVIDPQTGEPMVVYHGTGYDFGENGNPVAFRDDRAIMITPSPGYANNFAFYGKANVMPLFANIRNPTSTEDQNKAEDLPYWQDIEELRAGENDGLIYSKKGNILKGASGWGDDIPQYAVFSPEQLKSAIGNNGDFKPNTRDVRHSKGATASTTLPQQTAERLIASELGSTTLAKVLVDSGIVSFVNRGSEFQGATFENGNIVLNLDALTEQNFAGVFKHEGFHSTVRELVGEETWNQLMSQLEQNLKAAKGNDWVTRANAAIPADTKASDRTEEIGAYAIEQYANGAKQPNFIKRWVESVLSAIRAALIRGMGGEKAKLWAMKNLKPQDLANLAIAGLKAKARNELASQGRAAMVYSVKRESLLDMPAVKIAFNAAGTIQEAKLRAKIAYAKLQDETQKNGFAATTTDGKQVKFSGAGFKEVSQHAADRRALAILANAKSLVESAMPLYSEAPSQKEQGVRMYHYYGVKADINGDESFALLEIKETTNGEWFYDADATDAETARAVYSAALADQTKSGAGVTEPTALKGRLAKWLAGVNGDPIVPKLSTAFGPESQHRTALGDVTEIEVDGVKRPALNSNGKPIHWSREGVENFWRWFGGSLVTERPVSSKQKINELRPMVVYHGTRGDFHAFAEVRQGNVTDMFGDEDTVTRRGIFFAENADFATTFANQRGEGAANVMPVYLDIKNAMYLDEGFADEYIEQLEAAGFPDAKRLRHRKATMVWAEFDDEAGEQFISAAKRAGYDGVYMEEEGVGLGDDANTQAVWVAFNPTQIKSATGNRGTFDGSNPDIRYSKASPAQPAPLPEETRARAAQRNAFSLPEWTKTDTVQERIQDRYNRIRDVVKAIRSQGLVSDLNNFDMGEDRFHGVAMAKIEAIEEDVLSLLKAAKAADITLEEATMYAYAEHAPERNKAMQAINPNVQTGSGMSDQEAADIIAKAKQEGKDAALSQIADNMRAIARRTLKAQLDAGLIEQSEYDNYTNKYQKWVPLRGFETIDEQGRTFRGTGKGFNIRGKENLRALGRDSKAGQILENIVMDAERTAIRSTKNVEVNHRFLRFVLDNPDPTLWEIDATKTKQALKNGRVSLDSLIDKGDNTIGVKVNGQVVYVKIHDQKLFEQLANMWDDSEFGAIPYLGEIQRYLAKSYTAWSPEFALFTNPVRDITAALVSITGREGVGMTGLFAKNYAAALKAAYQSEVRGKKVPIYAEYEAMGGKTGFWNVSTLQSKKEEIESLIKDMENLKLRNAWRTPLKLAKYLEKLVSHHAGAFENATRLAAYMAMKEAGKSKEEASAFAKNLNVNFNRRGTWTSGLGSIFLFFNPSIQGTHNMYSTMVNGKHKKQAIALMGAGIAGMFMLALMNAGAGEDDDGIAWWDKISDSEKQTNVIIVLPPYMKDIGEQIKDSTGRYIKFPMPYGFNAPLYSGAVAADVMRNADDPATGVSAGKGALLVGQASVKAFNPVGIPQAVAPFWQHYTNTGPFGGRLYPENEWNKNMPGSEKYSSKMQGSPWQEWASFVNEATGGNKYQAGVVSLPPAIYRNYMRAWIGGPMSFATAVVDSISEGDITKAPFIRKAYGEVDFNEDAGKYYDLAKKAEAVFDAAKAAEKAGDVDLAKNIRESDKVMYKLGQATDVYNKRLGETYKKESTLKKRSDMTEKERELALQMNEYRRSNIQEQYLKQWRTEVNGLR